MRLLKFFLNEKVIIPKLKFMKDLEPKIKKLKKEGFVDGLNSMFEPHYIRFDLTRRKTSDLDFANAGISFASMETQEPWIITIYLENIDYALEDLDYFIDMLYKMLGHEFIHRGQYLKRKVTNIKSFKNFESYYKDKDELMALAHDMFIYCLYLGMSKEEMIQEVDSIDFVKWIEFNEVCPKGSKEYKQVLKYFVEYVTL